MEFDRTARWFAATCVLGLVWLGIWLGARLRRSRERSAGKFHNERGQAGERRAAQLLRAQGYRIRARHVTRSYAIEVDGALEEVVLIADFMVERGGQRWIAEVKTGKQAPRVGYADTRRQMLEYQLAFAVPGVLLVDAELGHVREVRFPLAPRATKPRIHALAWALMSAALASAAWWALAR